MLTIVAELHVHNTDYDNRNQGEDTAQLVIQLIDNPQCARDRCSMRQRQTWAVSRRVTFRRASQEPRAGGKGSHP